MVVEGIQWEILDLDFMLFDTHQQSVLVILRELMLPDGFDSVSLSFTVSDVTTELSGSRLTSCRIEMHLQLIDHHPVSNNNSFAYKKTTLFQLNT
ncbi:unnamed protein product [Schistosoma margrebowiei]|uniref:Uncharacterized protein n=1 Tax=Schistosoma margrebowiei TaxID=48269 RepID=A0A183LCC3_9TREM|nr:unnamed protein product [Schistosoma margrebowiei]